MNTEDGSQQTYEDKYSVIHEWLNKVDPYNTEPTSIGEVKFKVFGFNLPDEKKTRVQLFVGETGVDFLMYWERDGGTWRPQIYEEMDDDEGCCNETDKLLEQLAVQFQYIANEDNVLHWGFK